jgi:hypothetical protein
METTVGELHAKRQLAAIAVAAGYYSRPRTHAPQARRAGEREGECLPERFSEVELRYDRVCGSRRATALSNDCRVSE